MYSFPCTTLLSSTIFLRLAVLQVLANEALQSNIQAPRYEESPNGLGSGADLTDMEMAMFESYLDGLLSEPPWTDQDSPLLYVEEAQPVLPVDTSLTRPWKRSRYYRRYPWKRENVRNKGEEQRYVCNPSREDVFQLLVALHDAREGNSRRTVNFCNRKRPAATVFTNIRFLGRRRK